MSTTYKNIEILELDENSKLFKIYDELENLCVDLSGIVCASWLTGIEFEIYSWYIKDINYNWLLIDECKNYCTENTNYINQLIKTAIDHDIFIAWIRNDKYFDNSCHITFKNFLKLYHNYKNKQITTF